jgi:transcriptional regulator of NAD metabolism
MSSKNVIVTIDFSRIGNFQRIIKELSIKPILTKKIDYLAILKSEDAESVIRQLDKEGVTYGIISEKVLVEHPMLMLKEEKDKAAFLKFLEDSGIEPIRLTQLGSCSIVLRDDGAEKARNWLKENNVAFMEMPILVEQG